MTFIDDIVIAIHSAFETYFGVPRPQEGPESCLSREEVGRVLDDLESNSDEPLDWRHSIVDLLKLLNLDSSVLSRKLLADELGVSGGGVTGVAGSAEANTKLHEAVVRAVAERRIELPCD